MNQGKASRDAIHSSLASKKEPSAEDFALQGRYPRSIGMEIRHRRLRARTKPCRLLEGPGKLNANSKNLDKAVLHHKRKDGAWHGKTMSQTQTQTDPNQDRGTFNPTPQGPKAEWLKSGDFTSSPKRRMLKDSGGASTPVQDSRNPSPGPGNTRERAQSLASGNPS
ncbi:hypothetical protein CSAL01_03697 [Colletotrichum salicis]|uniref:Uncharacterized protein n=1 Tax=Colletotrichum salicis TaxID=1209931 RepID=A0A135V5S0_9PEZI|nr:hypothetical protein CSAL01_03697 [Colletotrichum salicis]